MGCINKNTNKIGSCFLEKRKQRQKRIVRNCLNSLNDDLNDLVNNSGVFFNDSSMSTLKQKSRVSSYNETNDIINENILSTPIYNADGLIAGCNFGNVKLGNSSEITQFKKYTINTK